MACAQLDPLVTPSLPCNELTPQVAPASATSLAAGRLAPQADTAVEVILARVGPQEPDGAFTFVDRLREDRRTAEGVVDGRQGEPVGQVGLPTRIALQFTLVPTGPAAAVT